MYDFNNYNSPEKGNKHYYMYNDVDDIQSAGFIRADSRQQAEQVLAAHNDAWLDYSSRIYFHYTDEQCKQEIERRKQEKKLKEA